MKNFVYCQNDEFRSAEYGTVSMERRAKFGFVLVCNCFDFVSFVAFDDAEDYAELVNNPRPDEMGYCNYNELEAVKVGESYSFDGNYIFTRLW